MKYLFTSLLLGLCVTAIAQRKVQTWKETASIMGQSKQAICVRVFEMEEDDLKNFWKKELKKQGDKINTKKNEISAENVEIKGVDGSSYALISKVERESDTTSILKVAPTHGNEFTAEVTGPAEVWIKGVGFDASKEAVSAKIKIEENKQKALEKKKSDLEKDQKKMENLIKDCEAKIKQAEEDLKTNAKDQDTTADELKVQTRRTEYVKSKLETIK